MNNNIIAEEQKGCKKRSLGCKEQLIIDSIIMNQACSKKRNLYGSFIDYKKAYDMIPHSWLIKILELYKIDTTTIRFFEYIMSQWKTTIIVFNQTIQFNTNKISIRRGIFQEDHTEPTAVLSSNKSSVNTFECKCDINFNQSSKF
jgi:hypothetical protein